MCKRVIERIFVHMLRLVSCIMRLCMYKKPFGAGTKRCVVLLALVLVCNFYILSECLLTGIVKRKRLRPVSYGIFYFNKVCSCKILMCTR